MAALITALDNSTPMQYGENGHTEYSWSNSIQEKILQFSFQVTRTDDKGQALQVVLRDLLTRLKHSVKIGTLPERELAKGYLSVLYRIIGQTRDIIDGKGEYTLSYMMIFTWYEFFPVLAKFALKCLVDLGDNTLHQYGSWKDLKYFCEYGKKQQGADIHHPLVQYSIELLNTQLRKDSIAPVSELTLVAKWIPREKSSFDWLYEALASNFYPEFMRTASTAEQKEKATRKCKTQYRKLLSSINVKIDTTQVKQCAKLWSEIDFNKVTSITTSKQKKAFLNVKKDGTERFPDDLDRVECAEHFKSRIKQAVAGEVEMKGKRVGMADFTKQAIELIRRKESAMSPSRTMMYNTTEELATVQLEIDLLNSQWRDNSTQNGALDKVIPMVDVSGSMEGDPMHVAIALGLRIAEKSILGKRVMTFSAKPTWVNLDGYETFVDQVALVKRAEWGMNTNLYAAFDTILDSVIQNKLKPEEVQDMVLAILSDMQIDAGDDCDKKVLYDTVKAKYAAAGVRLYGEPFKPPHILFWNLRSTSGFPSMSNQPNVSMMAGFSPALLNQFCEQGLDAFQSCTPWSVLEQGLENDRYKIMGDYFNREIEA
jgi:uncharacterized protein with von Willebrand factor type A (vWA) domain